MAKRVGTHNVQCDKGRQQAFLVWKRLKTGTLANREDPDEVLQNATIHQNLHCLLIQNRSSEKEKKISFENHNWDSFLVFGPIPIEFM